MAIETREDFDFRPDFAIQREERVYDPSALDIAAAGFRRQNPLSNIDFFTPAPVFNAEPGYDPFADPKIIAGFEPWAKNFALSESQAETEHIKQKIRQENSDRETLNQAGWNGILAEMAGGVSNPVLWLAGVATGGASLPATIGQVALAEATSEVILQGQQETRTWQESAVNVAAAAAVTGVLGGAVHVVSKRAAARKMAQEMAPTPPPFKIQELQPGLDKWTKDIVNDAGKIVGQVDGTIDHEAGELIFRNQFVEPEARGKGLSGKAWKEVVDYAIDNGMTVRSDSSVTLAAARPYEKLDPEKYTVVKHPKAKMGKTVDGDPAWKAPDSKTPVFVVTKKYKTPQALKDTAIVDKAGKPRVVYHATYGDFKNISVQKGSEELDHGLNVFNRLGAHFTDNPKVLNDDFFPTTAEGIDVPSGYWEEVNAIGVDTTYAPGANIRPTYLNIKKPFNIGSEDSIYMLSDPMQKGPIDWKMEGIDAGALTDNPKITEQLRKIFADDLSVDEMANKIRQTLQSHGYDGLQYVGELGDIKGATAFVAFDDKQIISQFDPALIAANAEQAAIVKQMADDIASPGGAAVREIAPTNVNVPQPDDFVPTPSWTPDQLASKADVPESVAKHLSYGNPLMRLMTSPANATRSVTESLLETPMYLRKNREGLASEQSIETLIKVDTAPTGEALQITRDAFNRSQGLAPGEVNFVRARIKAGWRGEHRFKEAVGRALRRGDGSDDPLVAQTAAAWREKVFDPLKERAMKLELFPEQQVLRKELTALEKQAIKDGLTDDLTAAIAAKTEQLAKWTPDPKGADSYLTRLYNYQKLAEQADDFKAAVAQYLKAIEGYTEAEAKKAARSIHSGLLTKDNMFGIPKPEFRGVSRVSRQAGGALQERTITLPDNILEPWLISDIEHVGRTYTRRMAAEINLAEKFGDRTLKKQIDAITKEYEDLVDAATSKKDKLILHNALRDNIRDLEAMRDQIIGTYGLPSDPSGTFARGNRMARSWQYVVALGMQTISALPDMARPIITNGMMAYAKGLTHAMPFMAKMAKEDVKRMGVGLDMLTSGRMRAIATMDEIPLVGGKFEHGLEELASGFGKVSGMDQWNSFWKQYTGIMAVDRIAQMAERGWTKLKPAEQAQLNWLGIDAESLNGIRAQFAKHGSKENGFNVANIASWDHGPARNLMAAANKEADTLIITPGKGDKPLLAATDIGKTLFQFQSFTAAATNRMAVSGLAQKDLRVAQSIFMGILIGSLSAYTKDSINGRSTDWAKDPVLMVAKGLEQAGTLGLVAQIPVDVVAAAYGDKSVAKALIGAVPGVDAPAEGLIRSGANILGAAQKGEGVAATKAAAKLLPYQNLFYLRLLYNEMGDGERSAIGLKRPEGNEGPAQHNSPFGG